MTSLQRLLTTAGLSALLGLSACGTDSTSFVARDAGAFSGTLTGRMVDREGKPLAGTLVIASPGGRTTLTGPDGRYEMAALPAGSYRVAAARDEFRDTALTDSVKLGLLEERPLPPLGLTFRYGTIRGTVTDSNGLALPGAGIAVQNQTAQTQSGEGGAYVLGRVEPGRIKLFTALAGIGYGSLDTVLGPQDTLRTVPLRIARKGGSVTGRIVDGRQVPLAGAIVTALGGALKATTDREGRFTLGQVPSVGTVGLLVDRDGVRQSVSGVRVGEGSKLDLEDLGPGTPASGNEPVSVSNGLVFAYTTDSLVTIVADTAGRDTTYRILRWLWSRDGLKTWDTTSTNVWKRSLSSLGWGVGDHVIHVCAYSMQGVMTSAVTQTVRVRLPPDTTAPALARSYPSADTTYLWRDSLVTVRWTVSEDRLLDSVRINDSVLDPSPGIKTFPLTLRPGLNLAVLRAVDRAGNATLDTLRLTLGARGAYDSSLASLKLTLPGGRTVRSMLRPALLNYADTVAWDDTVVTVSAVGADSTDTVLVNGAVGSSALVPLDTAGKTTTVRVQVRAFDGDTLDYRLSIFRKPFDSSYGILWKKGVSYGSLTDPRDGKSYRTVNVGGRQWMAQNLDHSAGGKVGICYNAVSGATASGPADTCAKYGRLYTWAEAMGVDKGYDGKLLGAKPPVQGVCPTGWHVPSDAEWSDLRGSLPGYNSDNRNASETALLRSLAGWSGETEGIDTLGFRVLPGGSLAAGLFKGAGSEAYFWTSDEVLAGFAKDQYLTPSLTYVGGLSVTKSSAISLRCVRDLAPPSDSSLAKLEMIAPGGARLAGFDPAKLSYSLVVGTDDSTVIVSAIAADPKATVTVGGVAGTKLEVKLGAVGSVTSVPVKVAATDGDVLTYKVLVSRTKFDSAYGIPWNAGVKFGTLKDARDGQSYRTVTVGKKTWMAQNLNYAVDSSWCPAGEVDSCGKYGRQYTWSAAMNFNPAYDTLLWQGYDTNGIRHGICPAGWHVPTRAEWSQIADTVLDPTKAGLVLKSMAGWDFLGNGSDSLGFRLLPAGSRNTGGLFSETGSFGMFWMTEQMGSFQGGGAYATYGDATVPLNYWVTKGQGLSLRCVQD